MDLFFHQAHDSDAGQHRLPAQTFPRYAIGKCLWAISYWLTQMPHEERNICPADRGRESEGTHTEMSNYSCIHYSSSSSSHFFVFPFSFAWIAAHQCFLLELLLAFASQVSYQPLAGESILRRHTPSHHRIQEGFPLTRVKAQYLYTHRQTHTLNKSFCSLSVFFFFKFITQTWGKLLLKKT